MKELHKAPALTKPVPIDYTLKYREVLENRAGASITPFEKGKLQLAGVADPANRCQAVGGTLRSGGAKLRIPCGVRHRCLTPTDSRAAEKADPVFLFPYN